MEFEYSDRCKELQAKLLRFMDEHIYPNEQAYKEEIDRNGLEKGNRWIATQIIEDLKPKARTEGLWNLSCQNQRAHLRVCRISITRLCAKSWVALAGHRKYSIAPRRILATWKP
jgi:alkylation response protein AidB-like acyl-CoA dehydrogenase